MGMDPRQFSAEQLAAGGVQRVGNHVRRALGPSLAGYFWLWLAGNPPTATHHAKKIKPVTKGDGRRSHTLVNDPALVAAWDWYLRRIPERSTLVPLRPPVALMAVFRWQLPLDVHRWPLRAEYGGLHTEKPDLDNSMKVLKDVLALRGYLVDDCHVAMDAGSQKRWCEAPQSPGVLVVARTIVSKHDRGTMFAPGVGDPPGHVYPLPWCGEEDLATVRPAVGGRPVLSPFYNPPGSERSNGNGKGDHHPVSSPQAGRQPEPAGRSAARSRVGASGRGTRQRASKRGRAVV